MEGMTIHNINRRVVPLGNNEYETGSMTIPANTTYTAGTLLKRGTGEAFEVAAAADTAIAVLPFDKSNTASVESVKGIDALIFGLVRSDMLKYAAAPTTPLTPAQRDALRNYGIIPKRVTDVSQLDNQ